MKRNYTFDLLRIVLSLFVIGVHCFEHMGSEDYYLNTILPVLFMTADGAFYILSGYFNLEKEFNNASDIKKFYKNKIIYVLFPFLAFVFVWAVWDYAHTAETFNFLELLDIYYKQIMNSAANGHLWFMYPLFGMLLSTPFLSKMLHNMDEKELKILWRIAIIFNVIVYIVCIDNGMDFRVSDWFLGRWLIYYFAGYYYRHVISKESTIKWAILTIACFVLTVLGLQGKLTFLDSFVYATDFQPMFTVACIGIILLFDKAIKIKNDKVGKVIVFLSTNTFFIYMYHMRGIEYIVRKLSIINNNFGNWLLIVFGTFVVSLLASIVTKLCMKPVQKFLDKVWVVK